MTCTAFLHRKLRKAGESEEANNSDVKLFMSTLRKNQSFRKTIFNVAMYSEENEGFEGDDVLNNGTSIVDISVKGEESLVDEYESDSNDDARHRCGTFSRAKNLPKTAGHTLLDVMKEKRKSQDIEAHDEEVELRNLGPQNGHAPTMMFSSENNAKQGSRNKLVTDTDENSDLDSLPDISMIPPPILEDEETQPQANQASNAPKGDQTVDGIANTPVNGEDDGENKRLSEYYC